MITTCLGSVVDVFETMMQDDPPIILHTSLPWASTKVIRHDKLCDSEAHHVMASMLLLKEKQMTESCFAYLLWWFSCV